MERFREITEEMRALYERKNADYGDSFEKSCDEWGLISCVIRLSDKIERLKSLCRNGETRVEDESLRDTLIDLANYAVMGIGWLDEVSGRGIE